MKNVFKTALFSLALLSLASCGDEETVAEGGIDTGDVKGDIDLMGAKGGEMGYHFNGQSCKAYKVELNDGAELMIFPDERDFEQATGDIERKMSSSFHDVKILNSGDDFIFFEETRTPIGKDREKTGYGFIRVVKKDGKTNYILESNGDTPLDPIWKKGDAEKLLKIAQSFVPTK
jgi:hypothetical protein